MIVQSFEMIFLQRVVVLYIERGSTVYLILFDEKIIESIHLVQKDISISK